MTLTALRGDASVAKETNQDASTIAVPARYIRYYTSEYIEQNNHYISFLALLKLVDLPNAY